MRPLKLPTTDFIRITNSSASSAEAIRLTGYIRSSFFSRCRFLRGLGLNIKRFGPERFYPGPCERHMDPGIPIIGGVRLNQELWTISEVRDIHEWLYPGEPDSNHWLGFPKHFRWLLAHNKKRYWFRIRDEEIMARKGDDRIMAGQHR